MSSQVSSDIGEVGVGAGIGAIVGTMILPGFGTLIGASLGAGTAGTLIGVGAAEQSAADQAAQQQYNQEAAIQQTAQIDNYNLQQEQIAISNLQTNQANQLAQFQANQATAETAETEQEQSAYTGAFSAIDTAEQQVGSQQAQAASGASNIIASAAARGIRVGAGAVNSGAAAGQGSKLVATQGQNGQAAVAGVAATGAVTGAAATPGSPAVAGVDGAPSLSAVAGTPALAAVAGTSQVPVTSAQAATPMQLSVAQGTVDIYDSQASPLIQLAAYERNANAQIGFEEGQVATAGNANLQGIAQQSANFETNAAQNLLGEETAQNQNMQAAEQQLASNQGLSALGEAFSFQGLQANEAFTQTNLAAYDSSLWLNAFSDILGEGATAFGKMYDPPTYQAPQPTLEEEGAADWSGISNLNFGNYYTPGG